MSPDLSDDAPVRLPEHAALAGRLGGCLGDDGDPVRRGVLLLAPVSGEPDLVQRSSHPAILWPARGCPCRGAGLADKRSHGWRSAVSMEW